MFNPDYVLEEGKMCWTPAVVQHKESSHSMNKYVRVKIRGGDREPFSKDERKLVATNCPKRRIWFVKFMRGDISRMGVVFGYLRYFPLHEKGFR